MRLERGIVKNNCPWGVFFEQQVVQIPTYAREGGGWGLTLIGALHLRDRLSLRSNLCGTCTRGQISRDLWALPVAVQCTLCGVLREEWIDFHRI